MSFQTQQGSSRDSHVRSDRAGANYGSAAVLRAHTNSRAYLAFDIDKPEEGTLALAELELWTTGTAWAGTESVEVRRLSDKWAEQKVTWNNKPGVTGAAAVAATAPVTGQKLTINVTTLVATGAGWRGLDVRLATGAGEGRAFCSSENPDKTKRPKLVLTWVEDPTEPVNLRPSDSHVISTPNPVLTWDWVAKTEQVQQAQVQVDDAADFATPLYDSGYVAVSDHRFPLTGHTLTASAVRYWRVRVKTDTGQDSPWSEPVAMVYKALPALVITSPADPFAANMVDVSWTFTGQRQAQVVVEKVAPTPKDKKPLWTSPWMGTTQTVQVPATVIRELGVQYRFVVKAWDAEIREAVEGAPDYQRTIKLATFSLSGSVSALTTLVATPDADKTKPVSHLTWTSGTDPDAWAVIVNGIEVARLVGSARSYDLWLLKPNVANSVQVARGVGMPAQLSSGNNVVSITVPCIGAWLWDEAAAVSVMVADEAGGAYTYSDDVAWYSPNGRTYPIPIFSTTRGLEGSVSGTVNGTSVKDALEALWRRGNNVRLVVGDMNIAVRVAAPSVDFEPQHAHVVQFPWVQVGE